MSECYVVRSNVKYLVGLVSLLSCSVCSHLKTIHHAPVISIIDRGHLNSQTVKQSFRYAEYYYVVPALPRNIVK